MTKAIIVLSLIISQNISIKILWRTHEQNWGIYAQNPSLTAGKALFPGKVLLGGLDDRSGVLVEGSRSEITAAVHAVLDEMANVPFILGADCTLPTDIDLSRIRVAVDAVNSYHK